MSFFNSLFESSTRSPFVGRPELRFFSERITIYTAAGDVIQNPALIWKSGSKNGLIHSLLAFSGRMLDASEVVIFLNAKDFSRITREWYTQCIDVLSPLFFALLRERSIAQWFDKNVRFSFSGDGHNGLTLDLQDNEFAIGLLDNRHHKTEESLPLVNVQAHIASASDSFQELGALYNDQIAWTLGAHPLDTVRIEKLQIPSALMIRQDEQGEISFTTNPAYENLGLKPVPGFPNRRLLTYRNQVLITLVLDIFELNRKTLDKSMLLNVATQTLQFSFNVLTLHTVGLLFQKNRFTQWVIGYRLYLHRGYELNSIADKALASFRIEGTQIWFTSIKPPCFVNDAIVSANKEVLITDGMVVNCSGLVFSFHTHPFVAQASWPYLGEIRFGPKTRSLQYGAEYCMGRDPECSIPFPNGTDNSNIIWRPEFEKTQSLPYGQQAISKGAINTYHIMVGPEHAMLGLTGDPSLRILHKKYPCFIRRGDQVLSLSTPNRKKALHSGDALLVGNHIFEVYFHNTPIWQQAESILLETPLYRALIS